MMQKKKNAKRICDILQKRTTMFILVISLLMNLTMLNSQTRNDALKARNDGAKAMQDYLYDIAVEEFEKALKISEELGDQALDIQSEIEDVLPSAYYNLAREYVRDNDAKKAIAAFEEAIRTGEKFNNPLVVNNSKDGLSKLYFAVGNNFRKEGHLDKALNSYEKAIEYKNDYAPGYLGKALVYMSQDKAEDFEEALTKAKETAEASKDKRTLGMIQQVAIRYYYNNAVRARQATRYKESADNLLKTIEFHPEYEDAYFLLSLVQNELGNYDAAIEATGEALKITEGANDEDRARIYFQLARAYQGKNQNKDACSAYKKAATGDYKAQADYARKHILKCE